MSTKKLAQLGKYEKGNGIVIYCCKCGQSFEETCGGFYKPIKYESDYHDRECQECLEELGHEFNY